ncbi:MAG: hypothetical protein R3F49_04845 [Planctomycetota bacterium]
MLHQVVEPPLPPPVSGYFTSIGGYMALDGDRFVLGGTTDDLNGAAGTVWYYEFDGVRWNLEERIDPELPAPDLYFGFGVDLDGPDLYISVLGLGLVHPTHNVARSGVVERYQRIGGAWTKVETIQPVSTAMSPYYCASRFAQDGDVMAMVCSSGTAGWLDCYLRVFEGGPGNWQESALVSGVVYLTGVDERFGQSLDVWGDWVAVGIPLFQWSLLGPQPGVPGQVAMYHRVAPGTWVLHQLLRASNAWFGTLGTLQFTDSFGMSLDMDEGRLLVGAPQGKNGNGTRFYGQAYMFELQNGQWVETERFSAATNEAEITGVGSFGDGVGLDGPYIVVGDHLGPEQPVPNSALIGRAYFYERAVGSTTCTGVPNNYGTPATLTARGSDVAHIGALDFVGSYLPPFSPVLMVGAPASGLVLHPGGSVGNLCLGAGVVRITTGDGPADIAGRWFASLDLPDPGQPGGFDVVSGSTWHFQLWYRQPGNPPPSNFSSAMAITFD